MVFKVAVPEKGKIKLAKRYNHVSETTSQWQEKHRIMEYANGMFGYSTNLY